MTTQHDRRSALWRWPLTLAALTIVGLLAALLGGSGAWRVLSWLMLVIPIAIGGTVLARHSRLPR